MVKSFTDEQLNFFKFSTIVVDEFPKALRQTFKLMWDNKFKSGPIWDDSVVVRKLLLTKEGWKANCKVPTNKSYEEWDCTALFQATIYAQTFALPVSKGKPKTLSELYVKPRPITHGSFHTSVVSPSGNKAETFALAIDQLRLLRNSFCHSTSSTMDKKLFDYYVKLAKDTFKALGVSTDSIDAVGNMPESHFPTEEVARLTQKLKIIVMRSSVCFGYADLWQNCFPYFLI